jgi:hypothetical protein
MGLQAHLRDRQKEDQTELDELSAVIAAEEGDHG